MSTIQKYAELLRKQHEAHALAEQQRMSRLKADQLKEEIQAAIPMELLDEDALLDKLYRYGPQSATVHGQLFCHWNHA